MKRTVLLVDGSTSLRSNVQVFLVGVFLSLTPTAFAQAPAMRPEAGALEPETSRDPFSSSDAMADDAALDLFSLDSQLQEAVVSSTKTTQRSAQSPAVITVIKREEIQNRGYASLAEILRSVPGFYDVHDLVTHNFGVRGVNGGARASGSILKLMIDGHPVDFRPSTGNFFGEELLPIQMIERVEVIRGPASALYGANAFLGVVNVITRSGKDFSGAQLIGNATFQGAQPGGGGGLVVGGSHGPMQLMLGGSFLSVDRSGLSLPDSSPLLTRSSDPLTVSRGDRAAPKSLLGTLRIDGVARGRLSLLASVQHLDAHGEFQDFAPLTHKTRFSLLNQNYRLGWEIEPREGVALSLSAHYLNASNTPVERFSLGRDDYLLVRRIAAEGFGFNAEGRIAIGQSLQLVTGADYVQEHHLPQNYDTLVLEEVRGPDGTVMRKAGTLIPGESSDPARFHNIGVFGQLLWTLSDSFSAVAGVRGDYQNIYGINPSSRAGLVYAPPERPLSLKLLYGSSFKAPSAVQLYTNPLAIRDVQGNPALKAQTAHTFELAGGHGLGDFGEVTASIFATQLLGRVEFVQKGLFLEAQNQLDEWIAGGEAEARFSLARPLQVRLAAALAKTVSRNEALRLSQITVHNPLFPQWQTRAVGDYSLPFLAGARLSLELGVIGPRESSQSNALERGEPYLLPPYLFTAAAFSTGAQRLFGERDTTFSLRVTNLANQRWSEPGFGGIDVPTPGLTAFATLTQQL